MLQSKIDSMHHLLDFLTKKKEARGSKEKVGEMTMEARGWKDLKKGSRAKEFRWLTEARKGKETDSPWRPQKGINPADTLAQ